MSVFAAIFIRQSSADPRDVATGEALIAAMTPSDQSDVTGVWSNDRAIIAQALTWNTPESKHEAVPEVCADTGRVIASWVRLDNRDELCTALKLQSRETLTDPQIILAAHRDWGADCADRFEGDFSFVIYDPRKNEVFSARDSLGVMPFTYYLDDKLFAAASDLRILHRILKPRLTPSLAWTARFLAMVEADPVATQYEELRHLSRAHHLTVTAADHTGPRRYFTFDGIEAKPASKPSAEAVDAYAEAFDRAVKRRLRSAYDIGAEISGGLDSGAIIAFAKPHLQDRLEQFHTYGFAYHEHDSQALHQIAMHLGLHHVHTLTSPIVQLDYHADEAPVLGVWPRPDTHGHYEYMFGHAAGSGIRTLLSGYGGDEVVTAMGGQSAASEAFDQRDIAALCRMMPGIGPKRAALGSVYWLYLAIKNLGIDLRRSKTRGFGGFDDCLLSMQATEEFGIAAMLRQEAAALDAAETYNERLLSTRRFQVLLSGRLEACAMYASRFGLEFRYPMFDRQLMIQVLQTPTIDRFAYGIQRYLHRRAVEPRLPDVMRVIRKNRMGRRIAPWPWELWHKMGPTVPDLGPRVKDLLDAGRLAEFEKHLCLDGSAFNALGYNKKAFLFVNYHLLKVLDYWDAGL